MPMVSFLRVSPTADTGANWKLVFGCVYRELGASVGVSGTGGTEPQQCRGHRIGMWRTANHTQHVPRGKRKSEKGE